MGDENPAWRMAKITLKCERYEDSYNFLKEAITTRPKMSRKDIDFISEVCKKYLDTARKALISIDESLETASEIVKTAMQDYRDDLIKKVVTICNDVLNLIDSALLPVNTDIISVIFFNKLKGDYYRYLSEVAQTQDVRDGHANRSKTAYETSICSIGDELRPSDPLYLRLILNYAVFQYEILELKEEAIEKLDSTFNDAVRYLDDLDANDYKDAAMYLQLYRDNIGIWREARGEESK